MSYRRVAFLAAVAALGITFVSADTASAYRGGGVHRGGAVGYRGGAVGYRGGAVGYRGGAVGYRGGAVGYRGGVYGGRYYRPGVGIAAGAAVGTAIAASQPWNGYGYQGYGNYDYSQSYGYGQNYASYDSNAQDVAYCAQRFKSYDPGSGTYLGYDGQHHPCP
jgi:hypothetical protein